MKKLQTIITLSAVASVILCSSVLAQSAVCPPPGELQNLLATHQFHKVIQYSAPTYNKQKKKYEIWTFYNYASQPWGSRKKQNFGQIMVSDLMNIPFSSRAWISASTATQLMRSGQMKQGPSVSPGARRNEDEICSYKVKLTEPNYYCRFSGVCSVTYIKSPSVS